MTIMSVIYSKTLILLIPVNMSFALQAPLSQYSKTDPACPQHLQTSSWINLIS